MAARGTVIRIDANNILVGTKVNARAVAAQVANLVNALLLSVVVLMTAITVGLAVAPGGTPVVPVIAVTIAAAVPVARS